MATKKKKVAKKATTATATRKKAVPKNRIAKKSTKKSAKKGTNGHDPLELFGVEHGIDQKAMTQLFELFAQRLGLSGADTRAGAGAEMGAVGSPMAMVPASDPYTVRIVFEGQTDLLCHRMNPDLVEWLASLGKGDDKKKVDYPEMYCYYDGNGMPSKSPVPKSRKGKNNICGSTSWMHRAMVEAGRSYKDPRSTGGNKMAKELVNASILVTGEDDDPEITPIMVPKGKVGGSRGKKNYTKTKEWDYLDRRPVTVNKARIIRRRPAFLAGWRMTFNVRVVQPQYMNLDFLRKLADDVGNFQGFADFRPKFGRAKIVEWDLLEG